MMLLLLVVVLLLLLLLHSEKLNRCLRARNFDHHLKWSCSTRPAWLRTLSAASARGPQEAVNTKVSFRVFASLPGLPPAALAVKFHRVTRAALRSPRKKLSTSLC